MSTPPMTPSGVARRDMRNDRVNLIVQYSHDLRDRFDAWRSDAVRFSGSIQTTGDAVHGPERDTAVGDCNNRWWH